MNIIKKVKLKNFYNYYDEQVIDFTLNKRCPLSDFDIEYVEGKRITKVLNVLGHNGSGKTNLLKPLPFLKWFLNSSFVLKEGEDIVFESFGNNNEPTEIEVEFFRNGLEQKYAVKLNTTEVIEEIFSYRKPETGKFTYVLKRNKGKDGNIILKSKSPTDGKVSLRKVNSKASNSSILSLIKLIEEKELKPNKSESDQTESALSPFIDFTKVESNINASGKQSVNISRLFEACKWYEENPLEFDKAKAFMISLDLGIDNIKLKEIEYLDEDNKLKERTIALCSHSSRIGDFTLPIINESTGTKSIFISLTHIYRALECGGIAVIDELDNDLHIQMLKPLIELFADERSNAKNAQLLFSCHSPEILNHMKKHQVYLTEKIECMSEAWRLDEVEGLRSDDNLYMKYMNGSLGGTANI